MGKPSGVVQEFRTSAKDCRQNQAQSRRAGEPQRESRKESDNQINFALYIGMIAENEKYLQKMLKKICSYQNLLYLCIRNNKIKSNNKITKAMKTIKADNESTRNFVSYEINGKYYEAWGEFHFNEKKNRWEHEHIGKRGGKYLIVW